ncbi:hypothetical protein [Methylobacillus flagellatus]|nr:hypothetical protein [Methylobacillus flagellatus]
MDKFNLQVNSSGAWRNVLVSMTKEQMQQLEEHSAAIAAIAGESHKWRIVVAGLDEVIAYCQAPDYQWQAPKRGRA